MNHHPESSTPQESPVHADSPGVTGNTTEALGRLSFEHRRTVSREQLPQQRGRKLYPGCHPLASKRSASHELNNPGGRQSPRLDEGPKQPVPACAARIRAQRRPCHSRGSSYDHFHGSVPDLRQSKLLPSSKGYGCATVNSDQCDSGYATRQNTGPYTEETNTPMPPKQANGAFIEAIATDKAQLTAVRQFKKARNVSADGQILAMVLQPDSSPISTEQLAAEVKGIYAGLVMVEAKCINIDAAQAANPKSPLGAEQWQALIALHRTLLYEHHDFLMATQHPSATPALRGLANKYSMPARMWKHGIHAFLEVLRHRRPQSQDYMLAFIYLAYQMMALLFETVPSFTDTWIECLGDLARYRMAIEEEKEAHATWGGVAARWYTMASDRHPAIGRLYHHLGILERPSLRKFCFYSKSLTCVIPFTNARDSLSTLCGPIVQDEQTIHSSRQSPEARIVTRHALVASGRDLQTIAQVGQDSLQLLGEQRSKLREFGAYFASTNIAALFQLGDQKNVLWQLYHTVQKQGTGIQDFAKPLATQDQTHTTSTVQEPADDPYLQSSQAYFADSFNFVLAHYNTAAHMPAAHIKDALSFVHVSLAYFHSLQNLRQRLGQVSPHTSTIPFDFGRIDFASLAAFLTTLALQDSITANMLECARQGVFLTAEQQGNTKPISEDFIIRGHIWSQSYFSSGWFDGQSEDDGRSIESASMMKARAARVLWLGLFLAFHTEHICYDVKSQVFSTANRSQQKSAPVTESARPAEADLTAPAVDDTSVLVGTSPNGTVSSKSSEDGFTIVKRPGKKNSPRRASYNDAKYGAGNRKYVGPGKNQTKRNEANGSQVVDENGELSLQGESLEVLEQYAIRNGYAQH
ncbi:putative tetratricopeptide-like helical domain superfamily, DNA/RNA-binding domain, Est1-type [Septoria linicola]|nr:putative tetratricopeptide-like helical domain superfamily, DNA/RNA-binding domain, Est1-type [Septoria linicola]